MKIFFVGYEFNIRAPLYKPNFVRINFDSLVLILFDFGRSGRCALVAFRSISSPILSLYLFFSHRTLFMFSNLYAFQILKKQKLTVSQNNHVLFHGKMKISLTKTFLLVAARADLRFKKVGLKRQVLPNLRASTKNSNSKLKQHN